MHVDPEREFPIKISCPCIFALIQTRWDLVVICNQRMKHYYFSIQNGSEEEETPPKLPEEDLLHTPLSAREMSRLSRRIVVEWDNLAGLMDIPRAERDDIRYSLIYNDGRSRAEKILDIFNNKEDFSREKLARCLDEIQQLDLIKPVITGEWRNV